MAESKYIQKKSEKEQTRQAGPTAGKAKKKKKTNVIIMNGKEYELVVPGFGDGDLQLMSKGGRAGFKMGSKCKLAMKGKGRAYGKNS